MSGGGVERVWLLLMREFLARGGGVTLLLHQRGGALMAEVPSGVRIVVLGTARTTYDLFYVTRYLKAHRPDIFISNLDHNNLVALLARALSFTKTRVLICQHNALSSEAREQTGWKYRVVPFFYGLLLPWAAAIVAVSKGVADDLAAASAIRRGRITVIHNPIIDDQFESRALESCPHPWFEDDRQTVIVAVGRLTAQKDFATLLRGFALAFKAKQGRLIVLGEGPLRHDLENLSLELGISEQVGFLGYQMNPLPFIRSASALVLSSRYEGFGNVIVEALGCGTPVIATDCPHGPAEILQHGKFGRLVPVGDPAALAAAMTADLRDQWPSALLKDRAAAFSVAHAADRYQKLFDAMLGGRLSQMLS